MANNNSLDNDQDNLNFLFGLDCTQQPELSETEKTRKRVIIHNQTKALKHIKKNQSEDKRPSTEYSDSVAQRSESELCSSNRFSNKDIPNEHIQKKYIQKKYSTKE